MVKHRDDEPADKAAERLKQMLDARRAVPDEENAGQELPEGAPAENAPPAAPAPPAEDPPAGKKEDC